MCIHIYIYIFTYNIPWMDSPVSGGYPGCVHQIINSRDWENPNHVHWMWSAQNQKEPQRIDWLNNLAYSKPQRIDWLNNLAYSNTSDQHVYNDISQTKAIWLIQIQIPAGIPWYHDSAGFLHCTCLNMAKPIRGPNQRNSQHHPPGIRPLSSFETKQYNCIYTYDMIYKLYI